MSGKSKIEWTDATWNPVTGCTKVSPGCKNCYAEKQALRFARQGIAVSRGRQMPWDTADSPTAGRFDVLLHPDRLDRSYREHPSRWKKPRMVFVCSMGDLFHENVPANFIFDVLAIMDRCPQHTFQVLTKRPNRMLAVMRRAMLRPNLWLGVSVEDQKRADERIPLLLQTPAAVRFVSVEPMLGPVDLGVWLSLKSNERGEIAPEADVLGYNKPGIGWVIVGGEIGPGARPMHPDWARSLRDQCVTAGVPFFFKQWGEWLPFTQVRSPEQRAAVSRTTIAGRQTYFGACVKGGVTATTQGVEPEQINRVGKAIAGRLLDGRECNEYPQ